MSVLRQFNYLSNERLDLPHFRSIESSIAADFDAIVGRSIAGDRALVIRGFTLSNATVGTPATDVQLLAADGIVYNVNASESGSFLWIDSSRTPDSLNSSNSRVTGSFTANSVNYVSIDFKRSADDSTTDLAEFLATNTLIETPKEVPLGRTLDYTITISSAPFSATTNLIPIAKITTDSSNQVSAIQDARPMMYRLASGGDFPNAQHAYTFPFGRQEDNVTDTFTGGDKNIISEKDWKDALMTRVWELGGGENWYSPTADRNIRLTKNPSTVFSNGDNFELVSSQLHWKGLTILFDNANGSGIYYNDIADQLTDDSPRTNLAIGECLYVDINRTQNLTGVSALVMAKATLQALGTPTVPGSRFIVAWRGSNGSIYTRDSGFVVNATFAPATTTSLGAVRLNNTAATPTTPTVPVLGTNNTIVLGTGSYTIVGDNAALVATTGATTAAAIHGIASSSGLGGLFTASSSSNAALRVDTGIADLATIDRSGSLHYGTVSATSMIISRVGVQPDFPAGLTAINSSMGALVAVSNSSTGDSVEISCGSANRALYVHGTTSAGLLVLDQAGTGNTVTITGARSALVATGGSTFAGVTGNGGSGGGIGVVGQGGPGAQGVSGMGGTGNSNGVTGTGSGTGSGVVGAGAAASTGAGVTGTGGSGGGVGGAFTGGTGQHGLFVAPGSGTDYAARLDGYIDLRNSPHVSTSLGIPGVVTRSNTASAWAYITITGGTISVTSSFNIDHSILSGPLSSSTTLTIPFLTNLATKYSVTVTGAKVSAPMIPATSNQTVSAFDLQMYAVTPGSPANIAIIDFGAATIDFCITVFSDT